MAWGSPGVRQELVVKTHREWKAEYKQMRFPMGVLQILNLSNAKVLIDSGLNLPALENRHRFQLDLGTHPNRALQNDWNELGAANFRFEAVALVDRMESEPDRDYRDDVKALEALWLEEKHPFGPAGYHTEPD